MTERMSLLEISPINCPLYITPNLLMFSLLILLAASLIVASGSMVIRGDVMTSLAFRESGFAFFC